MESNKFLEALKKSLRVTTDKALEEVIGLTQSTMISWRRNKTKLTTSQVASVVKKAIKESEKMPDITQ